MAGTFPGVSGVQQFDLNGDPLAAGQLSVFNGGTNTLSETYQDIGLSILSTNPLIAGNDGRIPLFFVADGTYKVRLTDRFGNIANGGFEYPQCPSIGASSSGGGGTPVDPTTVFNTGDPLWVPVAGVRTGWVRMNGRTIGNAISGASERANADCQALFIWIYNNFSDVFCPVIGGRSGNALSDFNAGRQITLLDMRNKGPFGLDDMGNAARNGFSGNTFAVGNATTAGSILGAGFLNIALSNLPNSPLPVSIPAGQGGHVHSVVAMQQPGSANSTNGTGTISQGMLGFSTGAAVLPELVGTATLGSGVAYDKMSPAMLGTWYMKL